jgi:hypothetical protein
MWKYKGRIVGNDVVLAIDVKVVRKLPPIT